MKQLQDASKELMDAVIFALNHSINLKRDGVDPMIPFAVVIKDAEKTIKAFLGDTPEYADHMFEKTIKDEKPDLVVYATDSYLTKEGIKYDAVLLKAYDKNDSEIYLIGQKFRAKTDTMDFEQIGNPGFLGTIINDLALPKPTNMRKPWWKFW